MKHLFFIISFIILSSFFLSCDGRDRVKKDIKTVLQEKKLLDSFSESISYVPESYSEKITDTILSNGFKIYLKTFTDMDNNIIVQNEIGKNKLSFRKIKNILIIKYENKIIFNSTVDNEFLTNLIDIDENNFIIKNIIIDNKSVLSPKPELYLYLIINNVQNKSDQWF